MRFLSISGLVTILAAATMSAQPPAKPAPPHLKDEMRAPWTRSNERFIRQWLAVGDFPLLPDGFDKDWLGEHGGETGIKPAEKMAHRLPDGSSVAWRGVTAWNDATDLSDGAGLKRDLVAYAFTTVSRNESGKALLSIGSDESIRVWVNGTQVLDRRTRRQLAFDEDRVEVELKKGENSLLVKLEQRAGTWTFSARVLEAGAVPPRIQEIGPSLFSDSATAISVRTDINSDHAAQDKVTVQVVGAGGREFASRIAPRGETVHFDGAGWPDGAYEIRCATRRLNGLLYVAHLPWYKGDAIAAAQRLVAAAQEADAHRPAGFTTKMLADMVIDRLGKEWKSITGNPWWAIHSPLMEFEELNLEAAGKPARVRPYGFFRLAYRDEVDGSPQFCRVYLPGGYDAQKKWPLVVRLHGYNPANPDYVRWWSADLRHNMADVEYTGGQGIIYMEPHGRGNTQYLGLGDQDIMRVVQLAKKQFSVDDDRVYLMGESMGGWGTWNVGTRHPDVFAAIAPIYGGSDYHAELPEEELGRLKPLDRFLLEKNSSWAMAEDLLHTPVLVHHGDADQSVKVDYSRYGVRLLERWGYNVRYIELPGYGHEELNVFANVVNWFLGHRRVSNPARVRIRSAELANASAYWVKVEQSAGPNEFMVADAEVVGPNTIRVDTRNVVRLSLSPGAPLIDPARAVKVVWNGDASTRKLESGRMELHAQGGDRAAAEKIAGIAGPIGDIFNTPFAIVTGTAAADPAMKDVCRAKGEALAKFWKQWQRQPARVFQDSELSDADAARYSLILIGGADANLVTRRFASKLPVEIGPDHVSIRGRSFVASDARVQAIFPHPLNRQRYVLVVAATSADGMFFWVPDRVQGTAFDFTIEDGHMAGGNQRMSAADMWVAGGWFDQRWQLRDDLVFAGDTEARSKAVVLHAPQPGRQIDQKVLDACTGEYEIAPGVVLKIKRQDRRLIGQVNAQQTLELFPVSDVEYFIVEGPVKLVFQKDASGKVVSLKAWQNGQEFSAKKTQ